MKNTDDSDFKIDANFMALPVLICTKLLTKSRLLTREEAGLIIRAHIDEQLSDSQEKENAKIILREVLQYCGTDYSQDKPKLKLIDDD